jgi:hypothetical protein
MNDMTPVIQPKSNQLTADDLIGGPRVITITGVTVTPGAEQPCCIRFDGDDGKPWYPCKSVGRVLVNAWGPDSAKYVGKSVMIYRDPTVTWGGMKVGGIRVKSLSHINSAFEMALTQSSKKKAIHRFEVLEAAPAEDKPRSFANKFIAAIKDTKTGDALEAEVLKGSGNLDKLRGKRDELVAECEAAIAAQRALYADDLSDDLDMGEAA